MGCGAGELSLVDLCARRARFAHAHPAGCPSSGCALARSRCSQWFRRRTIRRRTKLARDPIAVAARCETNGERLNLLRESSWAERQKARDTAVRIRRSCVRAAQRGMSLASQRQEVDGDKSSICKFWACSSAEMDLLRGHPSHPRWIAAWARTVFLVSLLIRRAVRHQFSICRTRKLQRRAQWELLDFGIGACEGVLVGRCKSAGGCWPSVSSVRSASPVSHHERCTRTKWHLYSSAARTKSIHPRSVYYAIACEQLLQILGALHGGEHFIWVFAAEKQYQIGIYTFVLCISEFISIHF